MGGFILTRRGLCKCALIFYSLSELFFHILSHFIDFRSCEQLPSSDFVSIVRIHIENCFIFYCQSGLLNT